MIKKIFNKNIIFLYFIFVFFNASNIFANTNNLCDIFYENIRTSNSELELYNAPIFEQEQKFFGFLLNQDFDTDSGDWIYSRDKNNNISIFNVYYYSNSYDKLNKNDKINKLNNIEVSSLSDSEIDDIIYNNDKIEFSIINNLNDKSKTFTIEKSFFEQVTDVVPIFRINSLKNIDVKNIEYTVNYDLEYWWLDNRLINLIRSEFESQVGIIKDLIEESKNTYGESFSEDTFISGWWCELTKEEFYNENLFLWHPEIEFINLVKNDLENKEIVFRFNYNIYGENYEELYLQVKENGIATFTKPSQLDFRAFPFDSHKLDFIYADVKQSISQMSFDFDHNLNLPLDGNVRAKIYEWNIPGEYAQIEPFDHLDYESYLYDGIKASFNIDRNSSYYIYKVLAPIMLILAVCWSVFWLRVDQIESRLTVSIVCLLTLIAYNFIVDENIPKLPYLTALDQIILSSYFFASIPTILSIVYLNVSQNSNENLLASQKYVRIIAPILYFVTVLSIMYANINKNPSALGSMKSFFG